MSHFTVLVPATNKAHLESVLLPYHEYECTGIKAYLQFVPEDMNELREKYAKYAKDEPDFGKPGDFEKWIPDWCGAKQNSEGVWGRTTNPNARWDWWTVGGRWSGTLKLKRMFVGFGENGQGGAFNPPNDDPQRADIVLAGMVDWDAMRQDQVNKAAEKWTKWHTLPPMPRKQEEQTDLEFKQIAQLWWHAAHESGISIFMENTEIDDLNTLTQAQYVEKYGKAQALTFAYIDQDGAWHERAKMGWFGMTDNPQDTYDQDWWKFVTDLEANVRLYLVDCHI